MKYAKLAGKGFELSVLLTAFMSVLVVNPAGSDPFWVAEKYFFTASVMLSAAFFAVSCALSRRVIIPRSPYGFPLFIFMAVTFFGIFAVYNTHEFFDRLFLNSCYIIFMYLIIAASAADEKGGFFEKLLSVYLLSAFIAALYGIMQSAGIDFMPWSTNFDRRASSTLGNPNFLAGHLLILIPVTYMLALEKNGLQRAVYGLMAAVFTAALFLTQTRGAYLGWAVSVIAAAIMVLKMKVIKKRLVFILSAALIFAGLLFIVINPSALDRIKSAASMQDESGRIRVILWKNSIKLISEKPIFGTGAGNFPITYPFYQSANMKPADFEKADYYKSGHAHNDFIQFAAEYGLPAAGLFFMFIFIFFRNAFIAYKENEDGRFAAAGIFAGIAGLMVHAFFNFPFQIVPTCASFFAMAAYVCVLSGRAEFEEKEINKNSYIAWVITLMIIVLAAYGSKRLTADNYLRQAKEAQHYGNLNGSFEYAQDAVRVFPDGHEYLYYAGAAARLVKNSNASMEYFKKAFDLNRGDWDYSMKLFEEYVIRRMAPEMLAPAASLYMVSPYSPRAIGAFGYSLFVNSKLQEAAVVFEKGMAMWPDNYDFPYQASAVYGSMGDNEKALSYASKAVAMAPNHSGALFNLAVAYYKTGNKTQAVKIARDLIRMFPDEKQKAEDFIKALK
ncbi:MAG: O-antigen ligase family protein [Candidatus Goldbacteria bacterium]|nr:O-antigen ligase family protein [Candidatus Goldiibacteriota bacterium]